MFWIVTWKKDLFMSTKISIILSRHNDGWYGITFKIMFYLAFSQNNFLFPPWQSMIVKLFITISATGFNCPRLELRFTKMWHYRARSVLALWSFSCNPERIIWVLKFQVLRRGNTEVYGKNRRKESGERTTHWTRIWRWQWVTNVKHISGKASAFYFWCTNLRYHPG